MRRVSQNSGCRFPFPSSLTASFSLLLLLEEGRKWIEKLLASDINTSKVFLQTTGAAWGCTLMCDTLITFDDDFLPPPLPAVARLFFAAGLSEDTDSCLGRSRASAAGPPPALARRLGEARQTIPHGSGP